MRPILVFDVNETLLDLRAMHAPFEALFGDGSLRSEWFGALLRKMLVTTITGPYVDFEELGVAALEHVAATHHRTLSDDDTRTVLDAMRQLPPQEDARPALTRLRDADYRCVALSNGTPDALAAQMEHANLASFFDLVVSADAAGRLKPAPEPYRWLANRLDVDPSRLCMIAAHAWDTTGAQRAGCRAGFVARSGKRLSAVDPRPAVVGTTLLDVVDQVMALPSLTGKT